MRSLHVIVVGGGLAGLSAALTLEKYGHKPLLLESSDQVGGRVKTVKEQGFLLDQGFQVVLDSYEELTPLCKKSLGLSGFRKGAFYHSGAGWKRFDLPSILSWEKSDWEGLFTLGKLELSKPHVNPGTTTAEFLRTMGAPAPFVDDFLTPFLRGVFLDEKLATRAERFLKLMHYFAWGRACLPLDGMQAIPNWFKNELKQTEFRFNVEVKEAAVQRVVLSTGEAIEADAVILALSQPQLAKLLPEVSVGRSCSTSCDYFALESQLIKQEPLLWLDARAESPINHFCFLSAVQPSYAPPGVHLISASAIKNPFPDELTVRDYLCQELELSPNFLRHLSRKVVEHALPSHEKGPCLDKRVLEGCYIAGEAVDPPSINDAIASGRKAAEFLHQAELLA